MHGSYACQACASGTLGLAGCPWLLVRSPRQGKKALRAIGPRINPLIPRYTSGPALPLVLPAHTPSCTGSKSHPEPASMSGVELRKAVIKNADMSEEMQVRLARAGQTEK